MVQTLLLILHFRELRKNEFSLSKIPIEEKLVCVGFLAQLVLVILEHVAEVSPRSRCFPVRCCGATNMVLELVDLIDKGGVGLLLRDQHH